MYLLIINMPKMYSIFIKILLKIINNNILKYCLFLISGRIYIPSKWFTILLT